MLGWVVSALEEAGIAKHCVIIGGDLDAFKPYLETMKEVTVCEQIERQGTGDAVASAIFGVETKAPKADYTKSRLLYGAPVAADYLFICTGDTPNIDAEIIRNFISEVVEQRADIAVLGMNVPNPTGYGRILFDTHGQFEKIVEEKDASAEEQKIHLCNSGLAFGRTDLIFECVAELNNDNAQGEYYFTDVFATARAKGNKVHVFETDKWQTFAGVNTREQLESLERVMLEKV